MVIYKKIENKKIKFLLYSLNTFSGVTSETVPFSST